MSRPIRVPYALVRATAAFLSTLARRAPEAAPANAPDSTATTLSSGLRSAGIENKCPVCQARFRGARICSRCGADLEPLMLLTVKAWQLRQETRQALDAGEVERARELVTKAQATQSTERGEALRLLATWLSLP